MVIKQLKPDFIGLQKLGKQTKLDFVGKIGFDQLQMDFNWISPAKNGLHQL